MGEKVGAVGASVGMKVGEGVGDTQILKPTPCELPSEWNANLVTPVTEKVDGNALALLVVPQYLVPPLTCR